jgi:uncharacterized protein (DUF2062 family)
MYCNAEFQDKQLACTNKNSAVAAAFAAALRSALFCFLILYDLRLRLAMPLNTSRRDPLLLRV